jgi:hypothetical protein
MREQAQQMVIDAEAAKTARFLQLQVLQRLGKLSGSAGLVGEPDGEDADEGCQFVQRLQARRGAEGLDLSGLLARNRVTISEIHGLVIAQGPAATRA